MPRSQLNEQACTRGSLSPRRARKLALVRRVEGDDGTRFHAGNVPLSAAGVRFQHGCRAPFESCGFHLLTRSGTPRIFRRMNVLHRNPTLADVAHVRQGHAFRGAIPAVPDGPVHVIQLKNLTTPTQLTAERLLRTRLPTRNPPRYVQHHDILLANRGARPLAHLLTDPPAQTVCSPHLYIIQVTATDLLLPAFLAWQLNHVDVQRQLRRQSAGSRQHSVRKSAVEQLRLRIPSRPTQQRIISVTQALQSTREQFNALMQARDAEITALTERMLQERAA